jgi:hypothetical protein
VSVADRGEPLASCSEWHAAGMAGGDNRALHRTATASARAMGEARPGPTSLVGKRPQGGARQRRPHAGCRRGLSQNVATRLPRGMRPNTPTATAAPNECLRTMMKIIQRQHSTLIVQTTTRHQKPRRVRSGTAMAARLPRGDHVSSRSRLTVRSMVRLLLLVIGDVQPLRLRVGSPGRGGHYEHTTA